MRDSKILHVDDLSVDDVMTCSPSYVLPSQSIAANFKLYPALIEPVSLCLCLPCVMDWGLNTRDWGENEYRSCRYMITAVSTF